MKIFCRIVCVAFVISMLPVESNAQIFKSKQTKRHKRYLTEAANYKTESRLVPIEVIVSVQRPAEASPKPPKTFLDLDPIVQKELIKRLEALEDTGSALIDQLKKNFSNKTAPDATTEIIDVTEIKRQIVVGVYNKSLFPGDRIYRIDATIKTDSNDVYFTSCDAVITKYETLEIAKQTQTTNLGFEGGGNAGSTIVNNTSSTGTDVTGTETGSQAGEEKNTSSSKNTSSNTTGRTSGRQSTTGLGANAKITASRSRTEEGSLRQRYVALSGNVLEKGVKLYTESISGIDLTGNIIAEVSFKFTNTASDFVYSFDKLYKANGNVQEPDSIGVKFKFIIYPTLAHDVILENICVTGVLRAVIKNQKTIMEGDDHVAMIEYKDMRPADPSPVVLARKSDVIPKKWVIKTKTDRLRIRTSAAGAGTSGVLYFDNVHQANAMLQWLRDIKPTISNTATTIILQKGKYTLFLPAGSLSTFINDCTIEVE